VFRIASFKAFDSPLPRANPVAPRPTKPNGEYMEDGEIQWIEMNRRAWHIRRWLLAWGLITAFQLLAVWFAPADIYDRFVGLHSMVRKLAEHIPALTNFYGVSKEPQRISLVFLFFYVFMPIDIVLMTVIIRTYYWFIVLDRNLYPYVPYVRLSQGQKIPLTWLIVAMCLYLPFWAIPNYADYGYYLAQGHPPRYSAGFRMGRLEISLVPGQPLSAMYVMLVNRIVFISIPIAFAASYFFAIATNNSLKYFDGNHRD
jgi:hypothetical protein